MLKGKLVTLRALEAEDMLQLAQWMNDPQVTRWLTPRFPISQSEQKNWYESLQKSRNKKKLLIQDETGKAIGLVSLMQMNWQDRSAELGIYIGEGKILGKGYGADSIKTLLNFAFSELGFHRVYLTVFAENTRAIKSFIKCGFVQEGIMREAVFFNNQFHDIILMSILSQEFDTSND